MSKSQVRVLVCGVAALGLILGSLFAVPWFKLHFGGLESLGLPSEGLAQIDTSKTTIDLRGVTSCVQPGICTTLSLSKINGLYPLLATATFWASLALCLVVLVQAAQRVFNGTPGSGLTSLGTLLAVGCFVAAFATAYLFGPETESVGGMSVTVQRTWGPGMLLLGHVLAIATVRLAIGSSFDLEAPLPTASVSKPTRVAVNAPTKDAVMPVPLAIEPEPVAPRKRAPSSIPLDLSAQPALESDLPVLAPESEPISEPAPAPPARPKLRFATTTADLSTVGLEAKREDHTVKLVRWRDVVGVVARRLPPEAPYDGATFVDLVSTAGSTLRILPWTQLTGETIEGDDVERARAFVQFVAARCPEAKLDGNTRTFLGGRGPATQLPDADTLAQHDERLA